MANIQIENLSFAYPGSYDDVFEDLSIGWDSSWRLGLVGRNGKGKTTLLRLLSRDIHTDEASIKGKISAPPVRYFPKPIPNPEWSVEQVAEFLCPDAQLWQLERELSLLEAAEEVISQPYSSLSQGEQTKIQLAILFLADDVYPLIDEPTNHLDLHGRRLLAAYLSKKPGFLLVSHDRTLLDACTSHTIAIERAKISLTHGSYSVWEENKQRQDSFELAENARLTREISHLHQAAEQTSQWSGKVEKTKRGQRVSGIKPDKGYIGAKSAKMMKRSKVAEVRLNRSAEEKAQLLHNIERTELLPIRYTPYHSSKLLEAVDISIDYGQRQVAQGVSFALERGERIALFGKNGSGKSSLLKLLLGQEVPHSGSFRLASQLQVAYLPQKTTDIRGSLRELVQNRSLDESLLKTILRKLDFERVQFEKDLSELSEGQRKKVLLAACLCQEANLYIWDEPLNYIDLFSRRQIEEVLMLTQPSMIFVEHDQLFVERVATQIIDLG